jgi:hypothetical protein
MASNRAELAALKNMIAEADLILETLPALPENRTARCRELLKSALALTDDLIKQAKMPAAKALAGCGKTPSLNESPIRSSFWFRVPSSLRRIHPVN